MTSTSQVDSFNGGNLEEVDAVPEWIGQLEADGCDRVVLDCCQPFFKVRGTQDQVVSSFQILRQAMEAKRKVRVTVDWDARELIAVNMSPGSNNANGQPL